jgi:hypothetical protein
LVFFQHGVFFHHGEHREAQRFFSAWRVFFTTESAEKHRVMVL